MRRKVGDTVRVRWMLGTLESLCCRGRELLAEKQPPLFTLMLSDDHGKQFSVCASDAASSAVRWENGAAAAHYNGFDVPVSVEVRLEEADTLLWTLSVELRQKNLRLESVRFPAFVPLAVPQTREPDALVMGDGLVRCSGTAENAGFALRTEGGTAFAEFMPEPGAVWAEKARFTVSMLLTAAENREEYPMKIMTFNIQHGADHHFPTEDRIDLKQIADVIRAQGAVLCGLNEVRGSGTAEKYTDQVKTLADELGWNGVFGEAIRFNGTEPYGNAFVTRYPILESEIIPIPDPEVRGYDGYYETRCVLRVRMDAEGTPFTVFVSHFGLNPDEAENAVNTVLKAIDSCDTPFAVMGDFNLQPQSLLLKPLFEKLKDTAEAGEGPMYSFSSDNPFEKIDYIFVSPDVKVTHAEVPVIIASDHCPYIAETSL